MEKKSGNGVSNIYWLGLGRALLSQQGGIYSTNFNKYSHLHSMLLFHT